MLIGYSDDKYVFEDPFSATRVFLTERELYERWHDFDIEEEKLFNYGIAVFGLEPNFSSEQIIQMK